MSKLIFSKAKCAEHVKRTNPDMLDSINSWANYCDGKEVVDSNGLEGKIYINETTLFYRVLIIWCDVVE